MRLTVSHQTRFDYTNPVSHTVSRVCLQPRDTPQQSVIQSRLAIFPEPDAVVHSLDRYGNHIVQFDLALPHERAEVKSTSSVNTGMAPMLAADIPLHTLTQLRRSTTGPDMLLAEDFLMQSVHVPSDVNTSALIAELNLAPSEHQGVLALAHKLTHHIYTHYDYDPGYSSVATPLADVIKDRRGVCQDFAHVAIAVCRGLGIPARYVSGYLETLPPPGTEKLRGADASHAWFSVWLGEHGWFDFDPTNNKRPDEQYITTAWGRDYRDVAPIRGVMYGGGKQTLDVAVDVDRATVPVNNQQILEMFPQ